MDSKSPYRKKHERLFRFKQFSVAHERSAMKVGVDGVLLGAWSDVNGDRLLDAGCGCGVISLMLAQRNNHAHITGIDIDSNAIDEAIDNAEASPWSDRITFSCKSFSNLIHERHEFDRIISNPPFFSSGIQNPSSYREISRHAASLSPETLIQQSPLLLSSDGSLSLISPAHLLPAMINVAEENGMYCHRLTKVVTVEGKIPKRILTEWRRRDTAMTETLEETLTIEIGKHGNRYYSNEYISLCSPFYLNMNRTIILNKNS